MAYEVKVCSSWQVEAPLCCVFNFSVYHVNADSKQVLHCKVFVGYGSCDSDTEEITTPFWLVNGSFIEEYPQHFASDYG